MKLRYSMLALRPACALLILAMSGAFAQANTKIYERAMHSTGWIIVPREETTAMGTCWVLDKNKKLVVTSYHLVKDAPEVLVFFPHHADGKLVVQAVSYFRSLPALNGRVIAADANCDLALVQLKSLPDGIDALPLAEESAQPGEVVHSIGNSGLAKGSAGTLWRYTRGNVRQIYERKVKGDMRAIQIVETQSPVNQGDSGGALLNDKGQVVGVIAAYDPNERLVSQNIDVGAVRAFVKQTLARKSIPQKNASFSLVGIWKVSAKTDDDMKAHGEAEFKDDGTYVLSDPSDETQTGRFAYANGILLLFADDGQANFRLNWADKNRFSGSTKGVELIFAR